MPAPRSFLTGETRQQRAKTGYFEPGLSAWQRQNLFVPPDSGQIESTSRAFSRSDGLGMATHITDDCINCGACEPECPNEAISEGHEFYVIDPELCTECVGFHDHEACQAVCPVECCLPDPKRREGEEALLRRALRLHPDDDNLAHAAASGSFPSRFRKQ